MALVNRLDLINEMGDTRTRPELDGNDLNMAVVAARYNQDVTKRLLRGAL